MWKANERFQSVLAETVSLTNKFVSEEKDSFFCGQRVNSNNFSSDTVKTSMLTVHWCFICWYGTSFQSRKEITLSTLDPDPQTFYLAWWK